MVDDFSGLIWTVIPAISGLTAAVVAAIALRYNAKSFNEFRNAEDLRVVEGAYRDIARNLKEFRLLDAESVKTGSHNPDYLKQPEKENEEKIRSKKIEVLLSETFADISWLCFLIRHDKIRDDTLVNAFKDAIIDWSYVFEERMPEKVHDDTFADFKILYRKYRHERHKKTE